MERSSLPPGTPALKTIYASIEPLTGEQNSQNNRLTRVLQVDGGTRRILYMEGEPSAGTTISCAVRWRMIPALHIVSILAQRRNKLYRQG